MAVDIFFLIIFTDKITLTWFFIKCTSLSRS